MYLHLGDNTVIREKSIILILDLEGTTVSRNTREFLKKAQSDGIVKTITDELPKTAIICEQGGEKEVYISQISASTLLKRSCKMEVTI
ncbi:MAG: DUF370 domain-containing protein [Firmicutes bacterium]|nr:DUF370 domain-containing protein [Bacillota bacterium]